MDYTEMIMLGGVVVSAIALNLVGKKILEFYLPPRILAWTVILLAVTTVHVLTFDQPVFCRVVEICVTLLLGMKLIVYLEWKRNNGVSIPLVRWLAFSFLWFGMEPRAWVGKRKNLEWKGHVKWALFCIVLGFIGLSVVAYLQFFYLPLSFIFMSMMFHFGVLRLNTALWRYYGIPVRVLFRNPITCTGFGDFWGARWNLAYSQMMARSVQRPLVPTLGKQKAIFCVFLISGLFHELAITLPAKSGYGLPTLFFLLHGIAVLIETKGMWLRYACLAALWFGIPILFPSVFVDQVILLIQDLWSQWIDVLL